MVLSGGTLYRTTIKFDLCFPVISEGRTQPSSVSSGTHPKVSHVVGVLLLPYNGVQ